MTLSSLATRHMLFFRASLKIMLLLKENNVYL